MEAPELTAPATALQASGADAVETAVEPTAETQPETEAAPATEPAAESEPVEDTAIADTDDSTEVGEPQASPAQQDAADAKEAKRAARREQREAKQAAREALADDKKAARREHDEAKQAHRKARQEAKEAARRERDDAKQAKRNAHAEAAQATAAVSSRTSVHQQAEDTDRPAPEESAEPKYQGVETSEEVLSRRQRRGDPDRGRRGVPGRRRA